MCCYHPDVEHFPITVSPEVFYFSHTTVMCLITFFFLSFLLSQKKLKKIKIIIFPENALCPEDVREYNVTALALTLHGHWRLIP